jgi:glutathione synthase/RimK-type ligase-like ATP-grasp enzyme
VVRVLLCARGGAPELPLLVAALRDRGAEPVILDSSGFPSALPVTLTYDHRGAHGRWAGGEALDIAAVWQSLVVGLALPAMAPGVRETCVAASELALVGLLESLQVFQVDPYLHKARADHKPLQLAVAQRLGLAIPETVISNDPDAVRAFVRRRGAVVAKMLVQPAGPITDGEADVVFTTAITAEDVAELDGLELCPMIFQEQIENQLDVRVTIAGRRVFGAALDRAARGGGDPDWRRQSFALDRAPMWAPYEVPDAVAAPLLRLLDHFGLNYGAADLIVRPDGRHVFLELNASGAFAFLGDDLARPIAAAIAALLVDPGARRVTGHG